MISRCQAVFALAAVLSGGAGACAQDTAAETGAGSAGEGYVIGLGDVLQVIVRKEPDLTREVTVRLDGMITVPLLGDLLAAGRAPNQLAEAIAAGLERYIEGPQVAVAVNRATSARFYVLGQVTRSGEFPLSGSTTVLQGLALAGGFREFAQLEDIVVIHEDDTVIAVNYKRLAEGKDMGQNIALRPGDTIIVP
jgi:polysaccharide export outer membrane protein